MKKLVSLIFLLICMSLFLSGCMGKPPETVTKEFLAVLQAGDFEKTATFVESNSDTFKNNITQNAKDEHLAKLIISRATFEVGQATKTGNQATVNVKVTAVDMVRIATKTMSDLMPIAFAAAFSDDNSNQDMDAIANQYIENSISDPQAPKVTTNVEVNLVKTKDGWKISSENDQLLDAITGNASKAFK